MGTKLYVGNLNYNTTADTLRDAFGANGREVVNVSLIMDRETGRPRGFAFVEMASSEFAQQALAELDGQELEGRTLRINEARERDARGPGSPRPGGFSSGPRPGGFGGGGGFAGGGGGGFAGGGGGFAGGGGAPDGPGARQKNFGPPRSPGGGRFEKRGTGRKDRDKPRGGDVGDAGKRARRRGAENEGDDW